MYSLKKAFVIQRITDHAKRCMCSYVGVVLVMEKDTLKDINCTHSLVMKACEVDSDSEKTAKQFEWANHLFSVFKSF